MWSYFIVIDGFEWFSMGSLYKNIQLMPEFLNVLFSALHFFSYSLMTFLMMLSVILLSMLMILTIWSGATTRIGLLRDTVEWCRKWFVDFNAGRTHLVSFDRSDNTGAIDVKMDGSVLEEKSPFKILGLTWGSYIISIAKNVPKKIGALIPSMKFVSPEVALYLC